MWVLDGGKESLFAYDLASGELAAEYALDSANDDPRGLFFDGVTFWVSDHGEKRLFAYRLEAGEDGLVVYAGGSSEDLVACVEGRNVGDGAMLAWPECLRGDIVVGFSLVIYEGGSVDDLAACARSLDITALYTLNDGAFVSHIVGAPEFVNRAFRVLFPEGLPAITPLVATSDGPPGGGSGEDGAAGN